MTTTLDEIRSADDAAQRFFNRELSWLEFNQRVLDEACDDDIPLLERLKFLSITAANLDEFFMVRVGGLKLLHQKNPNTRDSAGMQAETQLRLIGRRTQEMTATQCHCFLEELEPKLAGHGIRRLSPGSLSERQTRFLDEVFCEQVQSVLSPMAVDDRVFPLLPGRGLNICVQIGDSDSASDAQPRFAVIPCGQSISRFVTLPSTGGYEYTLLEDVIDMHIEQFFPGESIIECVPFRILRDADMSVTDELATDLLSEIQDVLDARKHSDCIRLEISASVTTAMLDFLQHSLGVSSTDVYPTPGPLDLSAFMQLTELSGYDFLRYPDWDPATPTHYDPSQSIFELMAQQDCVLCHPYESFDPVVQLLEEAADDPDVLAIKQTLYRTSRKSPIVAALKRAAESGKYVTAIIELKARFDEARNIAWAQDLERAGVQVIYGVKGLKTHAKICIVVRRESHGIQRYLHFGTGNYNEVTAQAYTDVSLMTCNPELGADASSFFNSITGYSQPQQFLYLAAAPINLRDRLLEMIQVETECCRNGHQGRIKAKLNALVDPTLISALYEASQAGVDIELNVRGICCLRPGVVGLSERIRVVSIIDRFLEHSRLIYFYHGGDERVFLSSADWMPRNLDRRVELLVPVQDPDCRNRLIELLETCLRDNVKGRELLADGSYRTLHPGDQPAVRSQQTLYTQAQLAQQQATQRQRTVFEPHRADASRTDT